MKDPAGRFLLAALLLVLLAAPALADKAGIAEEFANKPWSLSDVMQPLTFVAADVYENEPNDVCPGESYVVGDTFHGMISAGDADWISFSCDAGTWITVGTDADGVLPSVDTVIELYEGDCTTLLTSDDDGGPGLYSLITNYTAPYTGTYHLKVRGYSGTSSGNYILMGSCTVPPPSDYEAEPNNTCPGNVYTLGDIFHGAVTPGGDLDWVAFSCNAGDLITMETAQDDALPTVDTVIELYRDDCTTFLTSDDDGGPGLYSRIDGYPAPYTGTYHLKIRGYSGTSSGSYILQGSCEPPPPPPGNDTCATATPIPRCAPFVDSGSTELANNDYTPSQEITGGCTGYYAQGGDVVYRLDLLGCESLHIEYVNAADASIYIVTDCSDPEGTCVAGADDTFTGQTEVLDFTTTQPGTYYLICDTFSAFTAGGAYQLTVDWLVCPADVPDCPRSVGFWGLQALQKGNGSTKLTQEEVTLIASCIDDRSAFFDWGMSDFTGFFDTVLPTRAMDARKQAKRQYAGLLANVCTGELGLIASNGDAIALNICTDISCSGLAATKIGDLITEVDGLLAMLEPLNIQDPAVKAQYNTIKYCVEAINDGSILGPVCTEVELRTVLDITDQDLLALLDEMTGVEAAGDVTAAALGSPRPNPFRDQAAVSYAVPARDVRVTIGVYSVTGQRIRVLVDESREAGVFQAVWDGRDEGGSLVPSGVYFYRATIGDDVMTRRVVLLR
jgi:hypothetical protein